MPIEDGIQKATKNLEKAAEAAPTSKVTDESEFGRKNDDAQSETQDAERTHDVDAPRDETDD